MTTTPKTQTVNSSIDYKEIISRYTAHWKWFVLCAILALGMAYLYIRYSTPKYAVQTQIQILEDKSSGSELDVFQDIAILGGGKNKVEDELQIVNSRSNLIQVVRDLNLNTKIMVQGNIIETELYTNPPVNLNFISADSIVNKSNFAGNSGVCLLIIIYSIVILFFYINLFKLWEMI